jgi:hypothetical protein
MNRLHTYPITKEAKIRELNTIKKHCTTTNIT